MTSTKTLSELAERLRQHARNILSPSRHMEEEEYRTVRMLIEAADALDSASRREAELVAELDGALSRVEELELDQERLSAEFEKDCWKALRTLLDECNFDWGYAEPDGVDAEMALEHLRETLRELEHERDRAKSRAEALEADNIAIRAKLAERDKEVERLREALNGLFEGGFIESATHEHSQFAQELSARLEPCRAALTSTEKEG